MWTVFLCHVTKHGVWIGNWLYWLLKLVTTENYSVIANSHTLQFTIARTVVGFIFTSRYLITDPNVVLSFRCCRLLADTQLTHGFISCAFSNWCQSQNCVTTESVSQATNGAQDQGFLTDTHLRVCSCGASSPTRRRDRRLQFAPGLRQHNESLVSLKCWLSRFSLCNDTVSWSWLRRARVNTVMSFWKKKN
jgi:hypothetical protein